jgi:hypothetical protein
MQAPKRITTEPGPRDHRSREHPCLLKISEAMYSVYCGEPCSLPASRYGTTDVTAAGKSERRPAFVSRIKCHTSESTDPSLITG